MTKTIDSRFVGKWKGSDEGKVIPGQINFWKKKKKINGTFEIIFETHYEDGTAEQFFETGNWYVIDDVFYEYRESDEQTDAYQFEFLSPQIIQFIEINSDNENLYIFKDYKLIEN